MKIDRLIGILSILLQEAFGPNCFTKAENGRLLFTADYTDLENLVTWLLVFGEKAEVLQIDRSGRREDVTGIDYTRKEDFKWISVIRVPDFVAEEDFEWDMAEAYHHKFYLSDARRFVPEN